MVSRTLYDDVATEAYEDYQAWLQDEYDPYPTKYDIEEEENRRK